MSQIGNEINFGNQYSIYCSNLTVKELKNYNEYGNSYTLPSNSIIISSPTNNNGEDKNNPSVVITDYNSKILPLTYSFNKNHFVFDEKNNTISLNMTYIQTYLQSYFYSYFSNIFVRK